MGEQSRQLAEIMDGSKVELKIGYFCGDRAKPIVEVIS